MENFIATVFGSLVGIISVTLITGKLSGAIFSSARKACHMDAPAELSQTPAPSTPPTSVVGKDVV